VCNDRESTLTETVEQMQKIVFHSEERLIDLVNDLLKGYKVGVNGVTFALKD